MLRSSMRVLAVGMCLATLGMQGAGLHGPMSRVVEPVPATADVTGSGWKSFIACVGCVFAGAGLIATGSLVAAAWVPGSTLALAGCIAACATM